MKENMELTAKPESLDYEEGYHTKRHGNHSKIDYYEARAKIALKKFFSTVDTKDSKILDYGCGLGQNIYYLENAKGYDISEYGLDFCRQKGLDVTNNLEDLKDESFDVVFSSHVLEHHPYPKQMIEEMKSKLKPGSKLILVIPFEKHGKGTYKLDLNQHLYMWNFQNINNLLISCGFQINKNKYLRGAAYNKLLFLNKISFGLYSSMTNIVSRLFGIKEMMVIATKH
ncbi:class I SAM-dependent methyltransferase [Fulvivirga ligni]|uniref:class I SAM-dependent methyltransferase n=1 Tax=Fulvivirga ligni TaxID=2904246 RepID=UPI001F322212|nr:class I SAM-dependent methyltransferase [Fulvivirga ligni]UII19709.1 class I SAM-dependent methyltransferase [Fulvivirga ligni]